MAEGGILPPKTLQAFVDRIVDLDETVYGSVGVDLCKAPCRNWPDSLQEKGRI